MKGAIIAMARFLRFSIRYLVSSITILFVLNMINLPLSLAENKTPDERLYRQASTKEDENYPSPIPLPQGEGARGRVEKDFLSSYVGSSACRDCHKKEYESFMKYSKKAKSFESIERVKKGLTEDEIKKCYACHTTGYGKSGGFVSLEKTPYLKDAGCEVCHGPGRLHVKTKSRRDIKRHMTMEDCEVCHTSERVQAFRYKPMIHGGAH